MGNRPKSSHMSSTKRLKDTPLNRKPKTKVGLLRQIVECKAKLHRLQTKLEEKYVGVSMDSSPAVRKLNALIRRTSKQLGSLKMKQYTARASRRGTDASVVSEPATVLPPSPQESPSPQPAIPNQG